MRRIISYILCNSRTAGILWGTDVQRWTVMLAAILAPVLIATGIWATCTGMENDKLVCSLCALCALLSWLPLLMQAKDVEC